MAFQEVPEGTHPSPGFTHTWSSVGPALRMSADPANVLGHCAATVPRKSIETLN
jgi:hypothetical protein